jgi:hypothetical protein
MRVPRLLVTALSDWLHKLPASHIQALRDFRKGARAAYLEEDYLAKALDAGNIAELLAPFTSPLKKLSPSQEAAIIAAMPREFIVTLDH